MKLRVVLILSIILTSYPHTQSCDSVERRLDLHTHARLSISVDRQRYAAGMCVMNMCACVRWCVCMRIRRTSELAACIFALWKTFEHIHVHMCATYVCELVRVCVCLCAFSFQLVEIR